MTQPGTFYNGCFSLEYHRVIDDMFFLLFSLFYWHVVRERERVRVVWLIDHVCLVLLPVSALVGLLLYIDVCPLLEVLYADGSINRPPLECCLLQWTSNLKYRVDSAHAPSQFPYPVLIYRLKWTIRRAMKDYHVLFFFVSLLYKIFLERAVVDVDIVIYYYNSHNPPTQRSNNNRWCASGLTYP